MLNQASTSLIKKPYQSQQWTPEQIDEFTICIDDPIHFVKHYCYIQHPIKAKVSFDLFEYQEKLINTYNDYRYAIAMLPRQTGKSTAAAAYLLWYCMFKPDSTVLIAAHKYAGAQEIMQRVRFIYEMLPDWIKAGCTSYN